MARYILSEIEIEGAYPVEKILELSMDVGVNRHGTLTYGGLISPDDAEKYIKQSANKQIVSVYLREELEFCGYPSEISAEYHPNNDHCYLRVTLTTGSSLMDTTPHKRFFQDINRNFKEILIEAYQSSGAGSIVGICGTQEIRKPILQYHETDWELTLRMAGRLGTVVIPNVVSGEPQIALGIPERKVSDESNDIVYSIGRHTAGYRDKHAIETLFDGKAEEYGTHYIEDEARCTLYDNLGYQNFLYYKLSSDNRYKLGDSVKIDGKVLAVMKKSIIYQQGEFQEFYVLGHEQDFAVPFYHNKRIAGLELEGTVVECTGQQISLFLNIDAGRESYGKAWFCYSPATNNGMYSMPLEGETAALQWQSEADDDALVVRPVRKNSHNMPTPDEHHFTDENKNHLMMVSNKMEYTNPAGSIKWLAHAGFNISTGGRLEIRAEDDILIKAGGQVRVFSPMRVLVAKVEMNKGTKSSIDVISGDIHIKGVDGVTENAKANKHKRTILPERNSKDSISPSLASVLEGSVMR